MWSKTRKEMYERLAPSLKGKVIFNFDVYHPPRSVMPVFSILIDKSVWFATNPCYVVEIAECHSKMISEANNGDYWKDFYATAQPAKFQAIYKTGYIDVSNAMEGIHLYLNRYRIEECLKSGDYFLYLLAILDRRVGKRRIKKIYQGIESEPEWIRKFIILRAEAEYIKKKRVLQNS